MPTTLPHTCATVITDAEPDNSRWRVWRAAISLYLIITAVILTLMFGTLLPDLFSRPRRMPAVWRLCKELADNYGFHPSHDAVNDAWEGEIEGVPVLLSARKNTVSVETGLPELEPNNGFEIRRRAMRRSHSNEFEADIELNGDLPSRLLASMSSSQQARIRHLLGADRNYRVLTEDGLKARLDIWAGQPANSRAELNNIIATSVEFSQAVDRATVPDDLWEVAQGSSEVAELAYFALVKNHADTEVGRRAIESGVTHDNARIRYSAIIAAGTDAADDLLKVLSVSQDYWYGLESAIARALFDLTGHVSEERLTATLRAALDVQGGKSLRSALLRAVRHRRFEPAVGVICDSITSMLGSELIQAAQALGAIGGPAAEEGLVALLDDPSLRESEVIPIIDAIGAIGNRSSVAALTPLTEGVLRDGGIKQASRDAILQIQSRLAGAGAGQLALAGEKGKGDLAIAVDSGALAMSESEIVEQVGTPAENSAEEVAVTE